MAQRRHEARGGFCFELDQAELENLIRVTKETANYGKSISICQEAARWVAFFSSSLEMHRGEVADETILDK